MKRYVIIGGSIAGVSCVEGIRSVDAEGEITVVTAEPVSNYGRPLISYYWRGRPT
jgi:NADPH-dependent 2,4-dienoyl-CoA reductase/sulfur reductase-like enzyme